MGKVLILGAGDDAKWIYKKVRECEPSLPILGMSGERHWLDRRDGVAGFVNPGDLRDVVRNIQRVNATEVAFFGKVVASLGFRDISRNTMTILKYAANEGEFFNPTVALPNAFFLAIKDRLGLKGLDLYNLSQLMPGISHRRGEKIGRGEISALKESISRAFAEKRERRLLWRKHGALVLRSGEVIHQTSGTGKLIRNAAERGKDLKGATLIKTEVDEFKSIDVPVVDHNLIALCKEKGIHHMIVSEGTIVIDEEFLSQTGILDDFMIDFV